MKSKVLLSFLAVAAAALLPTFATCQVAPDRVPKEPTGPNYKYEVFAGYGYTSLNQVNQSRSGLQGVTASVTRNFGEHFGLSVDGGHYAWAVTSANTGNPTVALFLAGPSFHAPLYDKISGFAHVLLGGAHTGNVSISPSVSFAGGAGIGMEYQMSPHFALRAYGDDIASSFTLSPYQSGYSTHMSWNARAGFGVAYKF